MLLAGPNVTPGVRDTPVDLLDLFPTILQGAGPASIQRRGDRRPARPLLFELFQRSASGAGSGSSSASTTRRGSNAGGFMLRR
ncbi:hypothetical protein ACTMU2_40745 [Cupriavidus basilensis]